MGNWQKQVVVFQFYALSKKVIQGKLMRFPGLFLQSNVQYLKNVCLGGEIVMVGLSWSELDLSHAVIFRNFRLLISLSGNMIPFYWKVVKRKFQITVGNAGSIDSFCAVSLCSINEPHFGQDQNDIQCPHADYVPYNEESSPYNRNSNYETRLHSIRNFAHI